MDESQRLRLWSDALRAIANEGLRWSADDPYDVRRFGRVLRIAAEIFAAQDTRDADAIERVYRDDLAHTAPYPVGDAAIINERGEILLIQRKDDRRWAMPGGACAVGESPAEATSREAWEETGVVVEPLVLVGVYDSRICGALANAQLYMFVFLCRPRDPDPQPIVGSKTLDVGWYAEDALPPLSIGHLRRIADAFRCWRGERREAVFDGS